MKPKILVFVVATVIGLAAAQQLREPLIQSANRITTPFATITSGDTAKVDNLTITKIVTDAGIVRNRITTLSNQTFEEDENTILVSVRGNITSLQVTTALKEHIRNKMINNDVYPMVSDGVMSAVGTSQLVELCRFVVEVNATCSGWGPSYITILSTINTGSRVFHVIKMAVPYMDELLLDSCVIAIGDSSMMDEFIDRAKELLRAEAQREIVRLELVKSSRDLVDREELEQAMERDAEPPAGGQISHYQTFVTPTAFAVQNAATGKTTQQIYTTAISFVWVSDSILNGRSEKWLYPQVFLTNTPAMSSNPVPGEIASDCSEQANTLVSMLRASGMSQTDIRVAIGKVNFGGEVGGHAWVEIYEDGIWMALEATSGPYYDDSSARRVTRGGMPYTYWKYHEYPIVEVWAYYNDEYYHEPGGTSNAPNSWGQGANTTFEGDILFSLNQPDSVLAQILDFLSTLWLSILSLFGMV